MLQILGVLQQLAPDSLPSNPIRAAHLIAEAERLAYADRERYLADSDFVAVPLVGLTSPEYLTARAALVRPNRSLGRALPGSPPGAPVAELADDASPELAATSGSAIINHVVKTLVAVLDWNLDLQQAINLPNVGSRNGPTELELGTAAAGWAEPLRALGHEVRVIDMTSGVHGIQRTLGGWSGGADPRREGVAKGD